MKTYKLKNLRLKNRLIIFFLTTITLPLVMLGTFLVINQTDVSLQQAKASQQLSTLQLSDKIDTKLAQINSVANLFYLDKDLQSFLIDYTSGKGEAEEANHLFGKYNAAIDNTYFSAVVVAGDGKVFGNATFISKQPSIRIEDFAFYQKIHNVQSNAIWVTDKRLDRLFTASSDGYIYATRQLHNFNKWKPLGTLIIAISEPEIKKLYSNYVSDSQSTYILDRSGNVVSFSDNLNMGKEPAQHFDRFHHPSDVFTFVDTKGNSILSTHNTINRSGWKIVTYSDINTLLKPFKNNETIFLGSLALYFLATIILSIFSSERFLKPINLLYSGMYNVKNGDLDSRLVLNSTDEIGELSAQFNEMLDQIQGLVSTLVTEQKLKHEAEILALQTQINPHFLYNTLASIRYHIYNEDKESADETILALIRLLKNILSDKDEFIPVSQEISLLMDYIDIQKRTFYSALVVEVTIEPALENYQIIKLLLQPLVENAIMHGLKPKKVDCKLQISAKTLGDDMIFTISDNGVGFDTSKLDFSKDFSSLRKSIGMSNVRNRIKLTYHNDYDMHISSVIGQGTTISLKLPKVKEEYISYEYFNC